MFICTNILWGINVENLDLIRLHIFCSFALKYIPASKITDFGYTASYMRQASPELGGAPIIMHVRCMAPTKIRRTYDVSKHFNVGIM